MASATPTSADAASANVMLVNGRLSAPGIGLWTEAECQRFRIAMARFPTGPWAAIAAFIGTRTVRQTMSHFQKCRERAERHARGLKQAGRKRRKTERWTQAETTPSDPNPAKDLQRPDPRALVTPLPLAESWSFDWVMEGLDSSAWVDFDFEDGHESTYA